VSYLRAVVRRLDPWAALLLGGLLAMGVVILLATPGPWHQVVGPAAPVKLTPPAPDDVAVYVLGGRDGDCSGVIWLHLDAEESSLTAVVVAPKVSGFVPGAGYAPVSDIVDAAGPRAATAALSEELDVEMDAWVTLRGQALRKAIEAMIPMDEVRAARGRYRQARAAWRGRGGLPGAWLLQYESLRDALPRVPYHELGVVAFSNYVLGFGFVKTDLTLQGVASLGDALRELTSGDVEVRACSVVIETSLGAEVWRVDQSRLESLRRSLAFGLTPPDEGTRVVRRARPAHVLVVAPLRRTLAETYAVQVRRSLRRSAGETIGVTLVSGLDDRLAYRAARAIDETRPLAVLVAPSLSQDSDRARAAVEKTCAMLRRRGEQAVVAGPLPPVDRATAATGPAVAAAQTEFPVSPYPAAGASPHGAAELVRRSARAGVQTLVRACWPGALAPDLASTKLGFTFVAARSTAVGVQTATGSSVDQLVEQVLLWGYRGEPLSGDEAAWEPLLEGTTLYYRDGYRPAAVALAGDLGLDVRAAVADEETPRALVLVTDE